MEPGELTAPMDNPERAVLVEQMALQAPAIKLGLLLAGYLAAEEVLLMAYPMKPGLVVLAEFVSSGPETLGHSHQLVLDHPNF